MQKFTELGLNKENQNWLNLLIRNEEDEKTFAESFLNKLSPMFGILTFRNYLISKCRDGGGDSIKILELKAITKDNNKPKLIEVFSNMFLEVITDTEINYYIDSTITVDEIRSLHKNHPTLRFSSLLSGFETLLQQDKRRLTRTLQS